jgi:hypothetical protein
VEIDELMDQTVAVEGRRALPYGIDHCEGRGDVWEGKTYSSEIARG